MGLVTLSIFGLTIPEDGRFPFVCVLSLCSAFSFVFIGGRAAANGTLQIPFSKNKPVAFSLYGGFSVFVVVMLISSAIYL